MTKNNNILYNNVKFTDTWLGIMSLVLRTVSIMSPRITTLSIAALSIMTLRTTTLSSLTVSIKTPSITKCRIWNLL